MGGVRLAILAWGAALVLAGCGSGQAEMSAEEQAAFRGGGKDAGQRSPEAQKAISDFAENYRKNHPSSGGPPGAGGPPGQGGR